MDSEKSKSITIVVDDEQTLYIPFSPEPEFAEPVKIYIRSKLADERYMKGIRMTVISQKPIDEERFRAASANWIRTEKTVFRVQEKNTVRMLFGTLVFGSIMLVLCLSLGKNIDVLQYSLMPIMGSLALSKAASILVLDMPIIRAKRWILNGIEQKNFISFEYDGDKDCNSNEADRDKQTRENA